MAERVTVYSKADRKYLGIGTLKGSCMVFFFTKGGKACDVHHEQRPSNETIARWEADGWRMIGYPDAKKILMDDGSTVYSTQVHYYPIDEFMERKIAEVAGREKKQR